MFKGLVEIRMLDDLNFKFFHQYISYLFTLKGFFLKKNHQYKSHTWVKKTVVISKIIILSYPLRNIRVVKYTFMEGKRIVCFFNSYWPQMRCSLLATNLRISINLSLYCKLEISTFKFSRQVNSKMMPSYPLNFLVIQIKILRFCKEFLSVQMALPMMHHNCWGIIPHCL